MSSKHLARLLAIAVVAVAAFVAVPAASAATPAPGYTQFAGCPSPAENPLATGCLRSVIKGGYFQMGSKNVPITNPITLSGGINNETGAVSASPAGGLTPVKQKVPGGVIGLTGLTWLAEFLGSEALTLYAVTELAGVPVVTPGEGVNTNVSLPIRVHLINSTLGNNCYVGSFTSPIKLQLINGTTSPPPPNKPITGKTPALSFTESPQVIYLKDGAYVDNSFAAPGASGCVLTLFGFIPISINGLVNTQSGLPSPAGTNATEQKVDQELANQVLVYP
jgi:hypothetical protein